jgi:hypothetical protein
MNQYTPVYLDLAFILITFATLGFFYIASNRSRIFLLIALAILFLQMLLSSKGFYGKTDGFPPRFALMVAPSLILILGTFISTNGRKWMNSFKDKQLILIHAVRIPVELVLLDLFYHYQVPESMTFEGQNFDIFAGLTAPIIYWLWTKYGEKMKLVFLTWNILCMAFLINIIIISIKAAPSTIQSADFEQANLAMQNFPYVWLPALVVPLVLFAHLILIKKTISTFKRD